MPLVKYLTTPGGAQELLRQRREREYAARQKWRKENPELAREEYRKHDASPKRKVYKKKLAILTKDKRNKVAREKYKSKSKQDNYFKHMKYLYGISGEEYNNIFMKQGYCCAICGSPEPKYSRESGRKRMSFSLDHDHKTFEVRGILCHYCNRGLGTFRDDPALLMKALEYLKGSSGIFVTGAIFKKSQEKANV